MPIKKTEKVQGPTVRWLLSQIELFLELNEMENDGNNFGWMLCKDGTLVQRLRDGGDINVSRMDEALAFMQNPGRNIRATTSEGLVFMKPLKPLTIKSRSIP